MTKKIVLLCGERDSGKTKTLRELFNLRSYQRIGRITINNKIICVVGLGSPQEKEEFCHVKDVKDNIKKRIKYCERQFGNDFVLVIPFSIYKKRDGRTNENCIIKPIEWLKSLYSVHIIYLRIVNYADLIMEKITTNEIRSRRDYIRQAEELKQFIKKLL